MKAARWTLLLASALAGCSGVQSALDPAGDNAAGIAGLWDLMLWVCGFMYVLVLIFLAMALWKRRRLLTAEPPDPDGNDADELPLRRALSGWVTLIIVGMFALTIASFVLDKKLAQAQADDALHIRVTATQWWWNIEYEDAIASRRITTANELYLPVDRQVVLELHADDVIHSFWVPNLAGKKDLIPGRITQLSFTPTREGKFRGQCAEFCGLQHAQMALDVTVVSTAAFNAWQEQQRSPAPVPATDAQRRGLAVIESGACAACHQLLGTQAAGRTGPDLTHLASRRSIAAGALPYSPQSLHDWLSDPQHIKPGNHMPQVRLSDADRDALVAYLDTLK